MGRSAAKASSVGAIKALVSVHATPEAAPAAAAAAPAATEPVRCRRLAPQAGNTLYNSRTAAD